MNNLTRDICKEFLQSGMFNCARVHYEGCKVIAISAHIFDKDHPDYDGVDDEGNPLNHEFTFDEYVDYIFNMLLKESE